MIAVSIVGDGQRDEAVVPRLLERITQVNVTPQFVAWKDLHLARKGYARKLQFAIRSALSRGVKILVATVDTDRDKRAEKLKVLHEVLTDEPRCGVLIQVALSEATPHSEAWLLDDPEAIRTALALESSVSVPSVRTTKDPKQTIEELRRDSCRANDKITELLADIASQISPERCVHAKETGFHQFREQVQAAFDPHLANCPPDCPCGDNCPARPS